MMLLVSCKQDMVLPTQPDQIFCLFISVISNLSYTTY